jgi:hypothetical protein
LLRTDKINLSGKEAAEAQRQLADAQKQAAVATAKLSNSMYRLGTQTNEISRVQELNTDLQRELLDQSGQLIDSSKRITELSKEGIATATGGNSFCYMRFTNVFNTQGLLTPMFFHSGSSPLYDVNARIVDLEKWNDVSERNKGKPITMEMLSYSEKMLEIGNLSSPVVYSPPNAPVFLLNELARPYAFNILYNGRNGFWSQNLLLWKVDDHWSHAIRVWRQASPPQKDKLIYQNVDKDYPDRSPWKAKD